MRPKSFFYSATLWLLFTACSTSPLHTVDLQNASELQNYFSWHPDAQALISAHRGNGMNEYPENSLSGMRDCLKFAPCLMEIDIRASKDGTLILMHDETLDRTTDQMGKVSEKYFQQIGQAHLKNNQGKSTSEKIPTFKEVLDWSSKKAILFLDFKRPLSIEKVMEAVSEAKAHNRVVWITYHPEDAEKILKISPQSMISFSSIGDKGIERLKKYKHFHRNFVIFMMADRLNPKDIATVHSWGMRVIAFTGGKTDAKALKQGHSVYGELLRMGVDILATDNPRLAAKAITEHHKK